MYKRKPTSKYGTRGNTSKEILELPLVFLINFNYIYTMKARKTIDVKSIKEFANELLAHPDYTLEEKLGIITMIQEILYRTGNYNGFMFLNLIDGTAPALGTDDWTNRKYF